jgi:hypothetical protein
MVALAWSDLNMEMAVRRVVESTTESGDVYDIPFAPDYIIVKVDVANPGKWPKTLNLSSDPAIVHIPISVMVPHGRTTKNTIKLAEEKKIEYISHAVDLSFAITTWKSQGATLDYVIALLEHSPRSPKITFEMLYVMFSRVRSAAHFRCMPLSKGFRKLCLARLRPNVMAVKWRMDIDENGYWHTQKIDSVHDPTSR